MSSVNTVTVEAVTEETRDGVSVVHVCTLLDALFGQNKWMGIDPDIWNKAILDWVNATGAYYYSWEGPSYMRLAELDRGVSKTAEAGKTVLVIEALS